MRGVTIAGIYPPIATPFDADGHVDYDALRFNTARWMTTGLRGLVVLGSNGEAALVDEDEAERVVGEVRPLVPADRLVIAGTGRDATRATIAACRRAARVGADLALVRVPTAFKSQLTADALVRHYRAVADASPIPVLLYDYPAWFGLTLPVAAIVALAEHPNVVGMKESSGDLAQIADQVSLTPDRFEVVVGAAATLYASLCVGAVGGVVAVANVVPEVCVTLYEHFRAGRHAEALALQRRLTPLAVAVTATHSIAGLKAAMSMAGYRGGLPRAPLSPCADHAVAELRRLLEGLQGPA
ncbi:MAG: dihydrodipicolinate synthase family protein [Vicinamibacterales bacterium]|jgi:4-hydroxy-2-oxoglutarate aldolase|nr:dihydrodipicolinate synthase family protein [Vicinamibacterales bacterium]